MAVAGYDELTEIGRGRSSVVYRARELGTDRLVALKVIDVAGVDRAALDAFRREAIALAALGTHPHIVTLYRTVELADGTPALVLELCDGSLADRLATQGPLSPRRATAIAVKVAGALETAHRAGVLHLDVKPANVLVTQFGEPALTDFGIARLRGVPVAGQVAPGSSEPAIARRGVARRATSGPLPSTSMHAAPELLDGRLPGPPSDVYQLAASLYHLLAGRPPFSGFEGEGGAAVALRVLVEPPAPLPADVVPSALADLVLWAMAKDPADRPQTAAAFADALRAAELTCRWSPTAPAVPGGLMPRLVVPAEPSAPSPGAIRGGATGEPPTGARSRGRPQRFPIPNPGRAATHQPDRLTTPRAEQDPAPVIDRPTTHHPDPAPLSATDRPAVPRAGGHPAPATDAGPPPQPNQGLATRTDRTPVARPGQPPVPLTGRTTGRGAGHGGPIPPFRLGPAPPAGEPTSEHPVVPAVPASADSDPPGTAPTGPPADRSRPRRATGLDAIAAPDPEPAWYRRRRGKRHL